MARIPGERSVAGVTFDGERVWFASGNRLNALDPEGGEVVAVLDVAGDAGTAFDGKHLFQIAGAMIRKIDPTTGEVLGTDSGPRQWQGIPGSPGPTGRSGSDSTANAGIHQVDPETGAVVRTIDSDRFVTGVTWVDNELWHGTWEGETSDVRRIDRATGERLERLEMPAGTGVSGLESDGGDRFFCGAGSKVRAIRRPRS